MPPSSFGIASQAQALLATSLAAGLWACASTSTAPPPAHAGGAETVGQPDSELQIGRIPPSAVIAPHDGPTLYLGSTPDAPAIGYTAENVEVLPAEPPAGGRVKVRIEGALRVFAHAPVELLTSIVQRRGKIRGTPVYVGPGDRVHVIGPSSDPGRMEVNVRARLGDDWSDTYTGTFPAIGLALTSPPASAGPPAPGESYVWPAGTALTLLDKPGGEAAVQLPARDVPGSVAVVSYRDGWYAARVGHGPYLIGYTEGGIQPGEAPAAPDEPTSPSAEDSVPGRIARESGELRRVRQGAQVRFNGEVVAVFKAEGWARVLATYDDEVDVFAAADDQVAVRGLVPADQLYDAQ